MVRIAYPSLYQYNVSILKKKLKKKRVKYVYLDSQQQWRQSSHHIWLWYGWPVSKQTGKRWESERDVRSLFFSFSFSVWGNGDKYYELQISWTPNKYGIYLSEINKIEIR